MSKSSLDKVSLVRKALILEHLTVGWNLFEGLVAVSAGIVAQSIALVGFGLDSFIEVIAAATLIWRLLKHGADTNVESRAEKKAIKIVSVTFFALAIYVAYESVHALWLREVPKESLIGIALSFLSSLVMPFLGRKKRRIAAEIGSKALAADATESMVCAYLSVTVLVGLVLNAFLGWWWADPVAGLVIVGFLIKEGREAWEEKQCC